MYKKKIGIGLIHNNNKNRNEVLFPKIDLLKIRLENKYEVQLIDVSLQPKIIEHSLFHAIKRDLKYWILNREWLDYRLLGKRNILFDFLLTYLKNTLKKYSKNIQNHCRASFIETVVTDKHIKAWNILFHYAAKNDYFVFFEDDVVFLNDSIDNFLELLENISDITDDFLYVDLAGGCNINDLQILNLEEKKTNHYIHYKKLVTNTACCYLINRKTMDYFNEYLILNPAIREIGIDWMMNKIFIELDKKIDKNSVCLHTYPSIFEHGSVSGVFKPWER